MKVTRISLPFVRSALDDGADAAKEFIAIAYRRTGVPAAPRGTEVRLNIFAAPATGADLLGIAVLVMQALDGTAWESREQVVAIDVIKSADPDSWTSQLTEISIIRRDRRDD